MHLWGKTTPTLILCLLPHHLRTRQHLRLRVRHQHLLQTLQLAYGLTFSPCHRSLFAFFALALRLLSGKHATDEVTLYHLLPLFYVRKVLRINKRRRNDKKHRQSWQRWHRRLFRSGLHFGMFLLAPLARHLLPDPSALVLVWVQAGIRISLGRESYI